ncbi:hypothetical protein HDU96_002831 [Phlyctochytrium bullatum]|nr:hypothetical protein HDU96_002831 [Phlyctochytrium bullatum]
MDPPDPAPDLKPKACLIELARRQQHHQQQREALARFGVDAMMQPGGGPSAPERLGEWRPTSDGAWAAMHSSAAVLGDATPSMIPDREPPVSHGRPPAHAQVSALSVGWRGPAAPPSAFEPRPGVSTLSVAAVSAGHGNQDRVFPGPFGWVPSTHQPRGEVVSALSAAAAPGSRSAIASPARPHGPQQVLSTLSVGAAAVTASRSRTVAGAAVTLDALGSRQAPGVPSATGASAPQPTRYELFRMDSGTVLGPEPETLSTLSRSVGAWQDGVGRAAGGSPASDSKRRPRENEALRRVKKSPVRAPAAAPDAVAHVADGHAFGPGMGRSAQGHTNTPAWTVQAAAGALRRHLAPNRNPGHWGAATAMPPALSFVPDRRRGAGPGPAATSAAGRRLLENLNVLAGRGRAEGERSGACASGSRNLSNVEAHQQLRAGPFPAAALLGMHANAGGSSPAGAVHQVNPAHFNTQAPASTGVFTDGHTGAGFPQQGQTQPNTSILPSGPFPTRTPERQVGADTRPSQWVGPTPSQPPFWGAPAGGPRSFLLGPADSVQQFTKYVDAVIGVQLNVPNNNPVMMDADPVTPARESVGFRQDFNGLRHRTSEPRPRSYELGSTDTSPARLSRPTVSNTFHELSGRRAICVNAYFIAPSDQPGDISLGKTECKTESHCSVDLAMAVPSRKMADKTLHATHSNTEPLVKLETVAGSSSEMDIEAVATDSGLGSSYDDYSVSTREASPAPQHLETVVKLLPANAHAPASSPFVQAVKNEPSHTASACDMDFEPCLATQGSGPLFAGNPEASDSDRMDEDSKAFGVPQTGVDDCEVQVKSEYLPDFEGEPSDESPSLPGTLLVQPNTKLAASRLTIEDCKTEQMLRDYGSGNLLVCGEHPNPCIAWIEFIKYCYPRMTGHIRRTYKVQLEKEVRGVLDGDLRDFCIVRVGNEGVLAIPDHLTHAFLDWMARRIHRLLKADKLIAASEESGPGESEESKEKQSHERITEQHSDSSVTVNIPPITERIRKALSKDESMAWTDIVRAAFSLQKATPAMLHWMKMYRKYTEIAYWLTKSSTGANLPSIPRDKREDFLEKFLTAFYDNGEWRSDPRQILTLSGWCPPKKKKDSGPAKKMKESHSVQEALLLNDGESNSEEESPQGTGCQKRAEGNLEAHQESSKPAGCLVLAVNDVPAASERMPAVALETGERVQEFSEDDFNISANGVRLVRSSFILSKMSVDFPKLPERSRRSIEDALKIFLAANNQDISRYEFPSPRSENPGIKVYGIPRDRIKEFKKWFFNEMRNRFPDYAVFSVVEIKWPNRKYWESLEKARKMS